MPPPLGLRPLPFRKALRRFRDFGFVAVRQKGSHVRLAHPDGRTTVLPRHDGADLGRTLLMDAVRQAGIDPEEFFAAFR